MDVEHKAICALLTEGNLKPFNDARIRPEHFASATHREVFEAILEHVARYGQVPVPDTIEDKFPDYQVREPGEPVTVYLDRLRERHRGRLLENGLVRAVNALDAEDLPGCESAISALLASLAAGTTSGLHADLRLTGADRLARYLAFKDNPDGLRGWPTGFPTIDRATLGLQPGQLIVLGGQAKGGKTTVLASIARYAHRYAYEHGTECVPLIYTIEMGIDEIAELLDSQYAGVNSQKLRAGQLNQAEWMRVERAVRDLEVMGASFHIEKGIAQMTTLGEIASRLEHHKPDLLLVDGIYLMKDEVSGEVGTPRAITSITQGFKALADTWQIPTVITSQILPSKVDRKTGAGAASFGWSSSFAMDASVALAMDPTEDDEIKRLKIVASRTCPNVDVYLHFDWEHGTCAEMAENPFHTASGKGGSGETLW